ncbi:MAG: hypothetical protein IIW35_02325 [Bacteroidaceae bacterium]|nr:hypothetical protein [Bacteroidaceae bacterium]MBQ5817170.1 hypothetical protein [Bacteroidaceae bacterium]
MMKKFIVPLAATAIFFGCAGDAAKRSAENYSKALEAVQILEKFDMSAISGENVVEAYNIASELQYDYNPMELAPEQIAACEALKVRVANIREKIMHETQAKITNFKVTAHALDDQLFDGERTFPIYLMRGEKLHWSVSAQSPMTVTVSNADSRRVIKKQSGHATAADSLSIENSAIYLVTVASTQAQYIGLNISYNVTEMSRLGKVTPIKTEQIECNKGDFGAKGVPGIEMRKCFDEPRKFTLRGQIKAAFSGSAKAVVAVQVPAGATDILYSMRMSTSEAARAEDGKFHDNLSRSYKRIKFLGLPIYEKTTSNGLLNTILDDNRPLRDEDAYCNLYVFRNQSQAKQFQDGTKKISQLNYDIDYSTLGTQSCSGRIPAKGSKTIYLAFENERMRYTNYLWVEAEAIVPNTVYYRTKYSKD